MLRKILSLLILVVFTTSSLHITFASSTSLSSVSKAKIKSLKNGQKYIIQLNKVDKFIDSQTDSDLLTKIKNKVDAKKTKIVPSILGGDKSNDLTYELLNYISLKLQERLNSLSEAEQENIIKIFNNPELSDEEIKKVNDEIVKLQLNLFDSTKTFTDKLLSSLEKSLNVEEKGNFKFNIEGSGAAFGSAKGTLNVNNYESKAANFDSEFKAQVDLLIDASLKGAPVFKTQFSSFVNFISKDGNLYILLDKLNYSGINSKETNTYLEKLKELANNNEYLKIEDKNSTYALNIIRNFNINSIYKETNKVLLNPMFKPYKKVDGKYFLLPTKEACDAISGIEYKVTGKGKWYCSDSEYNNMLKESIKAGSFYIVVDGSEKYLGFDTTNNKISGNIKLTYSDKKIEKLYTKIVPQENILNGKFLGEFFELNFVNGQKLDITLYAPSEDTNVTFKSILASTNNFTQIDYIGNFSDLTSKFNLNYKKFSGSFEKTLKTYNYDWENQAGDYEDSGKITGKLTGELNGENTLTSMSLNINGTEQINKYDYNWETGESTTTPVNTSFTLNYSLQNEEIKGNISYKEGSDELFSVNSTGKYKKNYFELNNKIKLPDFLKAFSNGYSGNDEGDYGKDKMDGNLNVKYVGDINKNTFSVYLDFISTVGLIKAEINSDYEKIQNSNIKIEIPSNYKTIDEVFPKTYNKDYGNQFFQ